MADKTWSSLNKGAYNAATAYTIGDFVSYQGSYFTCVANSTGNAPTPGSDNAYWKLVASKGDTGATGTAATVAVGTVTTLNPGESATVTNSGSSSAATFNFGIPKGETGATGATGTSFTWKGDWSAVTAYAVRDVVYRLGSSYICIQAHTNQEPPNATYWELVAQKGVDGEGSGDVMGPASSVSNRIAAFDGVTGKLLKDGGKTIAEVEASAAATAQAASIPVGYLDTDGTLAANSDTKVATQKAVKTYADTKQPAMTKATASDVVTGTDDAKYVTPLATSGILARINAPRGFLINGKIAVSVASNNLTVAIKTLAGNDPSATDPVYIRIGDNIRSITAALSVTKNAGTNWCNSGSTELASKEIDYFAYLGYNATDGVVIGFSRTPGAYRYDDFSTTTTNEKYCAISTITNASASDDYEVIGRFAATLSAGAGYTWSVPTFTSKNLIQKPIYETRLLTYNPVISGTATLPVFTSSSGYYKRLGNESRAWFTFNGDGGTDGSGSGDMYVSVPVGINASHGTAQCLGNMGAYGTGTLNVSGFTQRVSQNALQLRYNPTQTIVNSNFPNGDRFLYGTAIYESV